MLDVAADGLEKWPVTAWKLGIKIMDRDERPASDGDSKKLTLSGFYFVCAAILAVIFMLDLFVPLGVAVGVLYLVVVLLTLRMPQGKATIFVAIVSSLLIVTAFYYKPPVDHMWKVIFNRGISLFAVWVSAILGLQKNKTEQQRIMILLEREKALQEVRILRGLLPICASCKKIRDDNGYWTQIEGYIKDHSEAEFTHGICPDCAKKLYPDFYEA
jgi:hypothetical protein